MNLKSPIGKIKLEAFKMAAVTKNRIFLVVNFALFQIKMNSNFNCSYMAMSSLIYMEGGAVGHNFEMGLPKHYPCQV
jgi:hypothetical protein